ALFEQTQRLQRRQFEQRPVAVRQARRGANDGHRQRGAARGHGRLRWILGVLLGQWRDARSAARKRCTTQADPSRLAASGRADVGRKPMKVSAWAWLGV